jgi:hypothetical protein
MNVASYCTSFKVESISFVSSLAPLLSRFSFRYQQFPTIACIEVEGITPFDDRVVVFFYCLLSHYKQHHSSVLGWVGQLVDFDKVNGKKIAVRSISFFSSVSSQPDSALCPRPTTSKTHSHILQK